MRTVVIRTPRLELSAQMAAMRKWFAKHRCDPSLFASKRDENVVSVYVQFKNDSEADTFKAWFKAQEQRSESDQNRTPCRYFLMSRSGRSIFSTLSLRRTREQ